MSANEMQVGGQHYVSEFQHWDWVYAVGLDYLGGCATKYPTRWRSKNGKQDLQKALHYLNKLQEMYPEGRVLPFPPGAIATHNAHFVSANKLSPIEAAFVGMVSLWTTSSELDAARHFLFLLLDEAEALEVQKEPEPVPLTEENHYSERA